MARDELFTEGWLTTPVGLKIYYRDYAPRSATPGPPVVCLHGWWRTSKDFQELAEHLSARHRVIAPDLRGRGRSDYALDSAHYLFGDLLSDMRRLLDALRTGPAAFVGLTLGAMLAIEMARSEPARVLGIVLNDTGMESPPQAGKRMSAFAGGDSLTYEEALERMRQANGPQCPTLTDADFDRLVQRAYRLAADGRYVRDFDQRVTEEILRFKTRHPDFWTEYGRLAGLPMLVLQGQNSDYLTDEIAERMLGDNPAATLAVVRDRGHAPMLDEPDAIAAIETFLERLVRGADPKTNKKA